MKRILFAGLTTFSLFCSMITIPASALNARFDAARHQTLNKATPDNSSCSTAQSLQFNPTCKG